MWNLVVLTVLVSLTGYYATANKNGLSDPTAVASMPYAESMAIYREAVIQYFTVPAHSGETNTSITLSALTPFLPTWSTMNQAPWSTMWKNYRDASGVIYIYAAQFPGGVPGGVVADIVELSQHSIFAGMYRQGATTVYSPINGNTPFAIPAAANIPVGSPVWVAMRR
jgi:hypothetical protein